jgi:hypothetical protein
VAAHSHGEDQLCREAPKQPFEGGDRRVTAPGLEGEEVHLVAGKDAEEEAVRGDQTVALDADAPFGGEGSRAWHGRC